MSDEQPTYFDTIWTSEGTQYVQREAKPVTDPLCVCGDTFASHDPGMCGNCVSQMRAELDAERARLDWVLARYTVARGVPAHEARAHIDCCLVTPQEPER